MDAFAIPLIGFTALLITLFVSMFKEAFDDPVPERAGITWAVTCPMAGLFYGVGLAPLAVVSAVVSVLALGSLAYWFLVIENGGDDEVEDPVEPDPGPDDDLVVERVQQPEPGHDWQAFDRLRADWEREFAGRRQREPERSPAGV
jgi:hypothetical protein